MLGDGGSRRRGRTAFPWVRAAPRTDPSVQRYRTGSYSGSSIKRCSGQGCEIGVRGSQRASTVASAPTEAAAIGCDAEARDASDERLGTKGLDCVRVSLTA